MLATDIWLERVYLSTFLHTRNIFMIMLKAMSLGNGVYCAGAGAERQRNGIISQRDTERTTRQEKVDILRNDMMGMQLLLGGGGRYSHKETLLSILDDLNRDVQLYAYVEGGNFKLRHFIRSVFEQYSSNIYDKREAN